MRFRLIVLILFASSGVGLQLADGSQPARSQEVANGAEARPNVLIVVLDDQRLDTMFFMPKTLRWLRDGGTEWVEAYANTPLCCPFRASLMSGRYQHNHKVKDNQSAKALDQEATIQKYLQDAGYLTAIDGKFLLHWPLDEPPSHFERWAHFLGKYTEVRWNVDGEKSVPDEYVTDFQSDTAVRFLDDFETQDARPWYLYLTPQAPHDDFVPAPQYADAPVPPWEPSPAVTETDKTDKPDFIANKRFGVERARTVREAQLRTLLSVDDMLDRIFTRLADLGELDNTFVIYTSDSGWHWSEHGMRSKSTPYTDSVRVPFFIRWPAVVTAGAIDERPTGVIDILPTVLEATSAAPQLKYPLDGRSLLQPEARHESLIEWHMSSDFPYPSWASIRNRAFQYIEWYADAEGTRVRAREYYDLANDPWQLTNLLGDNEPGNDPEPAVLADLATRLLRYRTCRGNTGSTACP